MTIPTKVARLQDDEFNPYGKIKSFCQVPRGVMQSRDLTPGAKLLYATLLGFNVRAYGTVYPKKETIRQAMGNPNLKSLYRWQCELVDVGLIRVLKKGKGLPNNYYFLRSPLLGNAGDTEFTNGPRLKYVNPRTGEREIVSMAGARVAFQDEVNGWADWGNNDPKLFPKPCWRHNRTKYNLYRDMCCILSVNGTSTFPNHEQVF